MLLKRNRKIKTEKELVEATPFLSSRIAYQDTYTTLAQNIAHWRLGCIALSIALAISVVSIVVISRNVRVVPYVIQVDKHGYAINIGPARRMDNVDQRIITAQLGNFIYNMRCRYKDKEAQLRITKLSYASIADGSDAKKALDAYFKANDPREAPYPVTVEISNVIPLTHTTYQAEWTERQTADGLPLSEKRYKGIFEIELSQQPDIGNIIQNPLGVYITSMQITQNIN